MQTSDCGLADLSLDVTSIPGSLTLLTPDLQSELKQLRVSVEQLAQRLVECQENVQHECRRREALEKTMLDRHEDLKMDFRRVHHNLTVNMESLRPAIDEFSCSLQKHRQEWEDSLLEERRHRNTMQQASLDKHDTLSQRVESLFVRVDELSATQRQLQGQYDEFARTIEQRREADRENFAARFGQFEGKFGRIDKAVSTLEQSAATHEFAQQGKHDGLQKLVKSLEYRLGALEKFRQGTNVVRHLNAEVGSSMNGVVRSPSTTAPITRSQSSGGLQSRVAWSNPSSPARLQESPAKPSQVQHPVGNIPPVITTSAAQSLTATVPSSANFPTARLEASAFTHRPPG